MCVIFNIQQVFRIEGVIPFGSMFPTTASLGKFYNRLSILITVFITGKFSKKALLLPRNCGSGGRWRSGLFGFLWPACDSVISCGRWVVTLSVCTFSPHTHTADPVKSGSVAAVGGVLLIYVVIRSSAGAPLSVRCGHACRPRCKKINLLMLWFFFVDPPFASEGD